jgi:hypothetical protein
MGRKIIKFSSVTMMAYIYIYRRNGWKESEERDLEGTTIINGDDRKSEFERS